MASTVRIGNGGNLGRMGKGEWDRTRMADDGVMGDTKHEIAQALKLGRARLMVDTSKEQGTWGLVVQTGWAGEDSCGRRGGPLRQRLALYPRPVLDVNSEWPGLLHLVPVGFCFSGFHHFHSFLVPGLAWPGVEGKRGVESL